VREEEEKEEEEEEEAWSTTSKSGMGRCGMISWRVGPAGGAWVWGE
jgi:hypothetical protein